ncbi:MAG TPA: hypothetical protein VFW28_19965 [Micropepsaceae bacterium]|nr:hypothetical protein [Micropepsaceae bacterium]
MAALDYSQISHIKPNGQVVMLWWIVPEIFMPNANNQSLLNVLSHYVVLGVVQGRPGPNGALAFDPIPPLQITDQASQIYSPIPDNMLPADVSQALATVENLARQTPVAPLAQGMHWSVYQADTIHSCGQGRMSVALAGETYIFDTPIPGCPKK